MKKITRIPWYYRFFSREKRHDFECKVLLRKAPRSTEELFNILQWMQLSDDDFDAIENNMLENNLRG